MKALFIVKNKLYLHWNRSIFYNQNNVRIGRQSLKVNTGTEHQSSKV